MQRAAQVRFEASHDSLSPTSISSWFNVHYALRYYKCLLWSRFAT